MAKGKGVRKNLDQALAGSEPMFESIEGRQDPRLTRAFNHYNYLYEAKDSQKWLLQWMKQNKYSSDKLAVVRDAPDWAAGLTAGWVARMALNGTKFPPENLQYIKDKIDEVLKTYSKKKEKTKPDVDIQARTKAKNNIILGLADVEVTDAFAVDPENSISMYEFLSKYSVSPSAANLIKEKIKPQFDEVYDSDPQVKEAFGKHLKKWQKFYTDVMNDLDRYLNNKKVVKVRKPRTVKVKPVGKLIEKLKYQKEFPPLKLVSANPQTIVGAQQLWTFNTKNRVLSVFYAENADGFSVKGTTLTGWNTDISTGKRLRKPEEVVGKVLSAGKVAIKKILSELTTTELKPNGRFNDDTIILRVMR